jgi:hypothetical protein
VEWKVSWRLPSPELGSRAKGKKKLNIKSRAANISGHNSKQFFSSKNYESMFCNMFINVSSN